MADKDVLDAFVKECSADLPPTSDEKFTGWEPIVAVLVFEGLRVLLPELKEWMKLGGSVIALKRQEISQKLEAYALEKELDFPAAEQAAQRIAERIDEATLTRIIGAFEN